jgi:ketosteroid isomerase-like protein/quercetin dioxygenase-like cupin family protein
MNRRVWLLGLAALLTIACAPVVNMEQERSALLALDREWSQSTKDVDKFMTYFAADASVYPPGMPVVTGFVPIRETFTKMSAAPGFALQWTPTKAEISASGDLGTTAGTYDMTMGGVAEKGKYVTVWKKQSDASWKVTDDIFNADAAGPPASQHVMLTGRDITWGDAPPALPAGSKMAVISGDPGKAGPFVVRAQMPPGYRIPPHWHPSDEHLTVLSGTVGVGTGDKFDQAALKDLPAGGYTSMPAEMRHFLMAKTATTIQVSGVGPFVVNYVSPADDPRQQKK